MSRKLFHRRGFTFVELALALVIAAAIFAALVQLLAVLAAQDRAATERQLAREEAANAVEQAWTLPWNELTSERLGVIALSARAKESLPEARLSVAAAEEAGPPATRRITVELDWRNAVGERVRPIRLVAWRYAPAEARP